MRTFKLIREEDVSGTSGTGIVAEGVEFTSGWVGLTWLTHFTSVAFYASITALEAIHGHGGRTKVVFDEVVIPGPDAVAEEKPKRSRKKAVGA